MIAGVDVNESGSVKERVEDGEGEWEVVVSEGSDEKGSVDGGSEVFHVNVVL